MTFAVGTLVRARGREWVVLPDSQDDLLMVRPLGGSDAEITGIHLPLEHVEPATFSLPDPARVGDHRSCRLLRDAVRLSTRAGAGPFRSFSRIGVEPRPYQLVPILMALKLNPVRLLIADDVGVGKTIEACLIARELLDRGEIQRFAVLCPPHLTDQWRGKSLRDKFHIDAEVVMPSTARRLESRCHLGQSLFEVNPFVVVSLDFIKSDRRRDEFVRSAPELVIVDEAHTCAFGLTRRGARHQRNELLRQLAADSSRHLILVTATPHSGKEDSFRSLLSLLDESFATLPEELAGPANEVHRRKLAAHLVQRRRADIEHFLDSDTPFPKREEAEATYKLSPEYRRLFERVLDYARETVTDSNGEQHRQRVRWWSAIGLLRSLASSPAAAAATLRNRAPAAEAQTAEEADEIGRRSVLDLDADEQDEGTDVAPGADAVPDTAQESPERRRLLDLARAAEALEGDQDLKLTKAVTLLKDLLRDGFRPIVFCRFIPTAEYLERELRTRLGKAVAIAAVTGTLPPADREARIEELAGQPKRVLVCTDCLSEGIDLQDHFDAVVHYDLAWTPTRHEQREGRVDRYGQKKPIVRVLTYFSPENQIDGLVLDILVRKHKKIRSSLGISVPVPVDTNAVVEAILEGLLLKEKGKGPLLPGMESYFRPIKQDLDTQWDRAADREKRSRTMFAQESIKVDEVAREVEESRQAIGSAADVRSFALDALRGHGAVVTEKTDWVEVDLGEVPRALRDALPHVKTFKARFELPVEEGVIHLARTHPIVEGLANHVLETALDATEHAIALRAGVVRTRAVSRRTTLLLVRFRYDITTIRAAVEHSQLAEECRVLAFAGAPDQAEWIDEAAATLLLAADPSANILPEQARTFVGRILDGMTSLQPRLDAEARERAQGLLLAHRRVRSAAGVRGITYKIEAQVPPDVLGVYVYLPTKD